VRARADGEFAPFWRSVAASASSLAAAPARDAVLTLVRDVLTAFRYVPGGFMDMYVIRQDPQELTRENDIFDALRSRVRETAQALDDAAREGELDPLKVRRALVELEGELLERGANDDAAKVRANLNEQELNLDAVSLLCSQLRKQTKFSDPRITALVENLAATLVA
jgi:hypothetical protein